MTATKSDEKLLAKDERWLLIQKVLASTGFRRADQLRKILSFLTSRAILQPLEPVREYEIAIEALGRKADFDPASDNIVRVQISQLRRKLETYNREEGNDDLVRIVIPRGSYTVAFESVAKQAIQHREEQLYASDKRTDPDLDENHERTAVHDNIPPSPSWNGHRFSYRKLLVANSIFIGLFLLVFFLLFRWKTSSVEEQIRTAAINPFLQRLMENRKEISVVLPDASLMVLDTYLNKDTSVGDYLTKFPALQLEGITDPELRKSLTYLASKRTTTFGEASIAASLAERLAKSGSSVVLRYARDLHVHDFGEGNLVIIGSKWANPWASLFIEKTNFRFLQDTQDHKSYFGNVNPQPGEAIRYPLDFSNHDRVVTYVDIVLTPNLTDSGSVLLISGSDMQATESAALYMLGSTAPERAKQLFAGKTPRSYEILLRGTHIVSEAEDTFEVVATRSK